MKKILRKLLFVTLLISGSAIYSQTALPGTIEVENGDLSQNDNDPSVNYVGDGNGGTGNVIRNFRKTNGINGTIINHVSIAADGNYDFTFTYFRSSPDFPITINSTDATGGSANELSKFTLLQNSTSGATTGSYLTQTVTNVPLTTGINYITITNAKPNFVELDNIIVTASAAKPVITLTGNSPLNLIEGDTYTDAGATAVGNDGSTDISGSIVVGGDTVDNTTTPGTYTITYNVSDSGVDADEVTRTVVVHPTTTRISSQTGNWNDTATWGGKSVPGTSSEVLILESGHTITVSDTQEVSSIKSNGVINVITGGALTVSGDVFLSRFDNGIQVQSGTETSSEAMGTIMIGGIVGTFNSDQSTSTADKRFASRRVLDNDKWYLLSSISSKQPRVNRMTGGSDFKTNATPAYSIAVYNNANSAGSKYDYFSTTLTNSDEVTLGAGMSVSVNGTGNTNTTGMFEYDAFFSHGASITTEIAVDGGTSDAFNLVGNPYLSNLHGNDNADGTNNLLKVNNDAGVLAEQTLWFWNADSSTWVTKNQSSAAFTVPPLTGFFVKSSVAGGNFTYTTAMETHTAAGTILAQKSENKRFEIELSISSGKFNGSTAIKFIDNTSISFDNGYDSSMFGGYASELEVYTGLVEGNSGKKLAIQSLPNSDFENMIIPIGVTAEADSEVTFSAKALNVPEGYKVFLEDRLNNTFTRLDEANAEYIATVTKISTEGRFYLHTKSTALSVDSALLNSISIYKSDASTLRIVGLSQGKSRVKLFNVLGKQVMSSNFNTQGVKEISLPKLATGVYIVQLETETGKLNKKIVLE